jgi:GDPmannose 4,6-dehydratase
MTTALIIGSAGQDGRIMSQRLQQEGRRILGLDRGLATDSASGPLAPMDILEAQQVAALIQSAAPDEVYYLAAYHHSSENQPSPDDGEVFRLSFDVHVRGLLNVLEGLRKGAPRARLFYAASSHIFGDRPPAPQDETTPLNPRCAYGITKIAGLECCRFYRQKHGLHASVGILYNHESPLRREPFVTAKIVGAAVAIKAGVRKKLILGDLTAQVDWGYAPDYVEAMTRIVRLDEPDDFVVATGETHSVQEFVEEAFGAAGLDWPGHVEENPAVIVRHTGNLVGNAAKLRSRTGWKPSVTFREMVRLLVEARSHER